MRHALAIVAVGLVSACATAQQHPAVVHTEFRYGPECEPQRFRALAEHLIAIPDTVFIPPLPVPRTGVADSAVLSSRVDLYGRPMNATIAVFGVRDSRYRVQLERQMSEMTFTPANIEGCAVEGEAKIVYRFGPGGPCPEPRPR